MARTRGAGDRRAARGAPRRPTVLMASQKANQAQLKSAAEFGKTEMSDSSELHQSVLRAILYAMMELVQNVDSNEVLAHLPLNVPD